MVIRVSGSKFGGVENSKSEVRSSVVVVMGSLAKRQKREGISGKIFDQIKDNMKCPICLDIVGTSFKHCLNGHVVCTSCQDRISGELREGCSICKSGFLSGGRPHPMYKLLLESLQPTCKLCGGKFCRRELVQHEARCGHRVVECPIGTCNSSMAANKLQDHFKELENHKFFPDSKGILVKGHFTRPFFVCHKEASVIIGYKTTKDNELKICAYTTHGSEIPTIGIFRTQSFKYHEQNPIDSVHIKVTGVVPAKTSDAIPFSVLLSNFRGDKEENVAFTVRLLNS